jgi:hypothetical protein
MGGYVLAGLAATMAPGFEVFPFFCWFLFPVTPTLEQRYALEVHELGGREVRPPTWFQRLDLVEDPFAMDAWTSIQALGRAVRAGDDVEVNRLRRRLEANFLPAPSRYGLVELTFDPLQRFRTGTVQERRDLAVFTSSTGCAEIPWAR